MSPLAADLSDLPRPARSEGTGLTPDQSPRFVGVLVDAWAAAHDEDKPTARGTRARHSDAGKCARAIAYTAAGFERSDPMDLAGIWNTTLGTLLHEAWQAALLRRFVGAEVEVTCGWDDLDASGHIDAVVRIPLEDRDAEPSTSRTLPGEDRPDGELLGMDGGEGEARLRRDRGREGRLPGASSRVGTDEGSDPVGDGDRSSVPESGLRQPGPLGASDHRGEQPSGGYCRDGLSEGSSVHAGEHETADESAQQSGMSGVRSDAEARRMGEKVIALELKTCGGYSFKSAVGKARRGTPAEGPRSEHILQGALNASAVGADELVIAYLAKECVSVNVADGIGDLARFSAEWTFTREDFEPLAKAERDRLAGILTLLDDGLLAARKVPDLPPGAEIMDVPSGRWEVRDGDAVVDTGTYFMCRGYCNYRSLCATTEPGRIPVESVAVTIGGES